jgi:hypothetical protein
MIRSGIGSGEPAVTRLGDDDAEFHRPDGSHTYLAPDPYDVDADTFFERVTAHVELHKLRREGGGDFGNSGPG